MMQDRHRSPIAARTLALVVIWATWPTGCGYWPDTHSTGSWVSPAPEQRWRPPQETRRPTARQTAPATAAAVAPVPSGPWHLTDMIDLALRQNPDTRTAWHAAQAAVADWRSQEADRLPRLDLTAGSIYSEGRTSTARTVTSSRSHTGAIDLSWLLFDFGGRQAAIEEKRQALAAASFSHNSAIQDVVLHVEQAFFGYLGTQALVLAYQTSVQEAQTNLEAARQRHQAGLATVADVLQAQTALSQARLNLQAASGRVQTLRGALATAVGIPIVSLPQLAEASLTPPLERVGAAVEDYLRQATRERPDLAAQRARVAQAQAHAQAVGAAMAPRLALNGSAGGNIDENHGNPSRRDSVALTVSVPLFDGLSRRNDTIRAQHEAQVQQARLNSLEQTAALQVWTSYFDLKTAAERVSTSADLVASAERLHEVALSRYREGVGAILDLMAARSSLENARAQQIQAQADWYIALAQLTHHAGLLADETPALMDVPIAPGKDTLP